MQERKKKKRTLFFSIEAVETKLKPLGAPFLWSAGCRNALRLALVHMACAWRWRQSGHVRENRSDRENEPSLASQPLWIPGHVGSGAPLTIQTPYASHPRAPASLSHLGSCRWWVKRDLLGKETKGHMLVKRNEGQTDLETEEGNGGHRCP